MTQTLTRTDQWLADFGDALEQGDTERAAGMFGEQSFWRDLIAFSWNIVTVEGPAGVKDLLDGTLATTRPTGWRTSEEPTEADGITEAWIEFETAVGRGIGLLRLRDGKAWTLLTALYELTGHEEPPRGRRPMGAEHGANRDRQTWLERLEREAAELGYDDPARRASSSAAARAASRSAPGCASSACRRSSSTSTPPRRPVAQAATSPSACTTRSGTTTCRTSSSPRTGRCSRRRTRSPTGWRCTRG